MSITIIECSLAYADSYHTCLDLVARERKYIALLEAPPIYQLRAYMIENSSCQNPHFLALADQRVIGWCDIVRDSLSVYSHTGILGMGINSEIRNQGIGRRLLQRTVDQAFNLGIHRIELSVFESNLAAIKLYQSVGFIQEGRQFKKHRLDGNYQDLLQFVLFA